MTTHRRWPLLATVASGLLLIALDNTILYTALPTLARELGASDGEALWIINAYPLVMAGLLLGAGTLGDRIGHRRMFLAGLVVFGVASLAAAFSPSPTALIAARALLAAGAAAMMPATLALIRVVFTDVRERNVAIAVWGSVALVGAALGPIAGGVLLERFWWGSVFLVNVPVVVAAFVAAWWLAPSQAPVTDRPWDAWSSLQALVALSGLVIAIKAVAGTPLRIDLAFAGLAAAVVGGALFARRQARLPYPLLDASLFRHPAFLSGAIAAAFTMFAIGGLQLVMTQRFQLVAGYTPMQAGMLVATIALGALPAALAGGAMMHRMPLRTLLAGGLLVAAIGAAALAFAVHADITWIVFGCLVTGAGLGATMSVASSAIVGNAPSHRAGMASSIEEVSYEFGSLLAVALLGSLIAALYSALLVLPADAPAAAGNGIASAIAAANAGGSVDADLLHAATSAYDRAYAIVVFVAAGTLAIGAAVTGWLLRGEHGCSQPVVNH